LCNQNAHFLKLCLVVAVVFEVNKSYFLEPVGTTSGVGAGVQAGTQKVFGQKVSTFFKIKLYLFVIECINKSM